MRTIAAVEELRGSQLSAVCFVRDYVEFHFDGPILRSIAPPVLVDRGRAVRFPAEGSRDALCALIGGTVQEAADTKECLVVLFHGDRAIEIAKESPGTGAEVAHFVPMVDGRRDVGSMMTWENLSRQ